jgi:hypothetical protein
MKIPIIKKRKPEIERLLTPRTQLIRRFYFTHILPILEEQNKGGGEMEKNQEEAGKTWKEIIKENEAYKN